MPTLVATNGAAAAAGHQSNVIKNHSNVVVVSSTPPAAAATASQAASSGRRSEVRWDDAVLTVEPIGWSQPLQICHIWLRDHCRCEQCYNVATFQRKQNLLDIPADIQPAEARLVDDGGEQLRIVCEYRISRKVVRTNFK